MERITDARILSKVKNMQNFGIDIALDGQYGRWRVTNKDGGRYLSPRASNREIYDWLFAYELGWDAGRARGISDMRHEREAAYDEATFDENRN